MTEKQINKWLRRQFSPLGWVLLGYLVLMNALVSIATAVDMGKQALWNLATGNFFADFDWDAIWNNAWGYIGAGLVVLAVLYAWKGNDFFGGIWRHKQKKMTLLTVLVVLGLCTLGQLANSLWVSLLEWIVNLFGGSILPMLESVSGASDSLSMFLYGVVFAPLTEELLFRGYVLHSLKPYGRRFAIVASAVLFGLFHGNLLQAPYAIVMGLVMGWLAMEHSFGWALGLHVFNNLVLAEGLDRATRSLPPMVAEGIILAVFAAFSLIALVILWAKRAEVRTYRRGEWIDRRCIRCLFTSPSVLLLTVLMAGNMVGYFFA